MPPPRWKLLAQHVSHITTAEHILPPKISRSAIRCTPALSLDSTCLAAPQLCNTAPAPPGTQTPGDERGHAIIGFHAAAVD